MHYKIYTIGKFGNKELLDTSEWATRAAAEKQVTVEKKYSPTTVYVIEEEHDATAEDHFCENASCHNMVSPQYDYCYNCFQAKTGRKG